MEEWDSVDVLLAEDNAFDAELTVLALQKIAPAIKVVRVHDGAEALQFIFRQGPFADRNETMPKLVLLDLDMPRAGGMEVLRQLREFPATKELPVAIITASTQQNDYFQTQELRALEYFVKPVDAQAFVDLARPIGLEIAVSGNDA